ncbi:hypothetical protein GCK32_000649 [Trichostrongylus colubriformis]|uniref:Uncharacterized protein n=1 Tax=Trichostrongylus colubriformis TaxID=6319 RepID=A0AAN8IRT7_TRICO
MELNAMTLAMRLANSVLSQLRSALRIQQVYILTDSEIVLNWIRTKPLKNIGTMIFYRLIEIGNITNYLESQNIQACFGHIPSELNPADCATRGLSKQELQEHFWWNGPAILCEPPESWASVCDIVPPSEEHADEPIPFSSEISNILAIQKKKIDMWTRVRNLSPL